MSDTKQELLGMVLGFVETLRIERSYEDKIGFDELWEQSFKSLRG